MIKYPLFGQLLIDRFNATIKKEEEYVFNCPKCGDTKRRFSFNLRLGVSNCFKCGYRPTPFEFLKENTDLSLDEIREMLTVENQSIERSLDISEKEVDDHYEKGIDFPEGSIPFLELNKDLQQMIVTWLIKEQGVKVEDILTFDLRIWLTDTLRVVIPCWDFDKKVLIYWIARALANKVEVRYLYPAGIKRSMIFWGLDRVELYDGLIFLSEGWKDAYKVKGLALLGSILTEWQVKILQRVKERYNAKGFIVLLDSDAIEKGWTITKRLLKEEWTGDIVFGKLENLKDPGEGIDREHVLNNTKLFEVRKDLELKMSEVVEQIYLKGRNENVGKI